MYITALLEENPESLLSSWGDGHIKAGLCEILKGILVRLTLSNLPLPSGVWSTPQKKDATIDLEWFFLGVGTINIALVSKTEFVVMTTKHRDDRTRRQNIVSQDIPVDICMEVERFSNYKKVMKILRSKV
jgi:hypothetical protein